MATDQTNKNTDNSIISQIKLADQDSYSRFIELTNRSLKKEYSDALSKVNKKNQSLENKKNRYIKNRESYRKEVKASKNQIISVKHYQEKIELLQEKINQITKNIDFSNEKVKSFSQLIDEFEIKREDIIIPNLICSSETGKYSLIDDKFIDSVSHENDALIKKIQTTIKDKNEVVLEFEKLTLSYLDKINQLFVEATKKISGVVNPLIEENQKISEEVIAFKSHIKEITDEKEYVQLPDTIKSIYKTKIDKFLSNSLKIEYTNYQTRKELKLKVKELIKELNLKQDALQPMVNVHLTQLSGKETTLLKETDKYNTLKKVYAEIKQRKKYIKIIKTIEEHLKDSTSNIVITKDTIEQYLIFNRKYDIQKETLKKTEFEVKLFEIFNEYKKSFSNYINDATIDLRNKFSHDRELEVEKLVNDANSKKTQNLSKEQAESIGKANKDKYTKTLDLVKSQIANTNRELISHSIVDREIKSLYEGFSLIQKINGVVKKLFKLISEKTCIQKYLEVLEEDITNTDLAQYEYNKLKISNNADIQKFYVNCDINQRIKKLDQKYDAKYTKHINTEKVIRDKIAYYKANPHKDSKGKKIEKIYGKLTKVQHYTNADNDEREVKRDYLLLSKDNHIKEIEYSLEKHNSILDEQLTFLTYKKEGGLEYAKAMMNCYKQNKENNKFINSVYKKVEKNILNELVSAKADYEYANKTHEDASEKFETLKERFNLTRNLQSKAVRTRKFSKNRTVGNRLKRAFIFIALFFCLGMIQFIIPYFWVGLIVGVVLTVVVEIVSFFASPVNFIEIDKDKNIIAYNKDGSQAYFFKNSEIINYSIDVFLPKSSKNVYKSKVVLTVETGADIYKFTYFDEIKKEFVINQLIEKVLQTKQEEVPAEPTYLVEKNDEVKINA